MWRKRSNINRSSSGRDVCTSSIAAAHPVPGILAECCTAAATPDLAQQLQQHYKDVGRWKSQDQLPIVYHQDYNITLFGVEKLHPFDSCKFQKVVAGLKANKIITSDQQLVQPLPVSQDVLAQVHSQEYLAALNSSSFKVAQVTELAPLALLPHFLVESKVLQPMRTHVGGTVLAAALAVVHGWAINLGGGMHHAHWPATSQQTMPAAGYDLISDLVKTCLRASDSRAACIYCPAGQMVLAGVHMLISLSLFTEAATSGAVQRVMVVDLDVHQGNGVERDKMHYKDKDLYIVDMYNCRAFPWDTAAKEAINVEVELQPGTTDEEYLSSLRAALELAATEFPHPQLMVYNAGTDILTADPLGRLTVSAEAVKQRDAAVFALAEQLKCPIVMLLSGGYTKMSAGVIVESLTSLLQDMAARVKPVQQAAPAGSS